MFAFPRFRSLPPVSKSASERPLAGRDGGGPRFAGGSRDGGFGGGSMRPGRAAALPSEAAGAAAGAAARATAIVVDAALNGLGAANGISGGGMGEKSFGDDGSLWMSAEAWVAAGRSIGGTGKPRPVSSAAPSSKAGGSDGMAATVGPSIVDGGSESPDGRCHTPTPCMDGEHAGVIAGDGWKSILLMCCSSSEAELEESCWTAAGGGSGCKAPPSLVASWRHTRGSAAETQSSSTSSATSSGQGHCANEKRHDDTQK